MHPLVVVQGVLGVPLVEIEAVSLKLSQLRCFHHVPPFLFLVNVFAFDLVLELGEHLLLQISLGAVLLQVVQCFHAIDVVHVPPLLAFLKNPQLVLADVPILPLLFVGESSGSEFIVLLDVINLVSPSPGIVDFLHESGLLGLKHCDSIGKKLCVMISHFFLPLEIKDALVSSL